MEKRMTVIVDYVMGSTKGFQDAAHAQGQQVQASIRQEYQHRIDAQKKLEARQGLLPSLTRVGSGIARGAGMGLPMMSGGPMAAIGATLAMVGGFGIQDIAMLRGGFGLGGGLRGHGISGMVDSAYGFFTGRATREAMEDFRMARGEYIANRLGTRAESERGIDSMRIQNMFRPNTETNYLKRVEYDRRVLESKELETAKAMRDAKVRFMVEAGGLERGKMFGMQNGGLDMQINHARKMQESLKDESERRHELVQILKQKKEFEAENLMHRKNAIKGDREMVGTMSPMQQEFVRQAAQKLGAGKDLMPEELSALAPFESLRDKREKYLSQRGDGVFKSIAVAAGDPSIKKAAEQSGETGKLIEELLEENRKLQRAQDAINAGVRELNTFERSKTDKSLELAEMLQKMTERRKLQGN